MRLARAEAKVPRAAFGVESRQDCDGFEQRGLARSVFSDEERDCVREDEPFELGDRGQGERVPLEVGDLVAKENDLAQVQLEARLRDGVRVGYHPFTPTAVDDDIRL